MGYPRIMGPGCAGATSKMFNVNVNQIQFGDKLQGLPPVTGRKRPYKSIRAKEGGNLPNRHRIYCINQLGSIGMGNKNSQFAANADGVGPCPNKKNRRGWHGLHQGAIGSVGQSPAPLSNAGVDKISSSNLVNGIKGRFHEFASSNGPTGAALESFVQLFENNFDETESGNVDSRPMCPDTHPYPFNGYFPDQDPGQPLPSEVPQAFCCKTYDFGPEGGGCANADLVRCPTDDPDKWTSCRTSNISVCPASHPYPFSGYFPDQIPGQPRPEAGTGQPRPEDGYPQAFCCASPTPIDSGGCNNADLVKCPPDDLKNWTTCTPYAANPDFTPTAGKLPLVGINFTGYGQGYSAALNCTAAQSNKQKSDKTNDACYNILQEDNAYNNALYGLYGSGPYAYYQYSDVMAVLPYKEGASWSEDLENLYKMAPNGFGDLSELVWNYTPVTEQGLYKYWNGVQGATIVRLPIMPGKVFSCSNSSDTGSGYKCCEHPGDNEIPKVSPYIGGYFDGMTEKQEGNFELPAVDSKYLAAVDSVVQTSLTKTGDTFVGPSWSNSSGFGPGWVVKSYANSVAELCSAGMYCIIDMHDDFVGLNSFTRCAYAKDLPTPTQFGLYWKSLAYQIILTCEKKKRGSSRHLIFEIFNEPIDPSLYEGGGGSAAKDLYYPANYINGSLEAYWPPDGGDDPQSNTTILGIGERVENPNPDHPDWGWANQDKGRWNKDKDFFLQRNKDWLEYQDKVIDGIREAEAEVGTKLGYPVANNKIIVSTFNNWCGLHSLAGEVEWTGGQLGDGSFELLVDHYFGPNPSGPHKNEQANLIVACHQYINEKFSGLDQDCKGLNDGNENGARWVKNIDAWLKAKDLEGQVPLLIGEMNYAVKDGSDDSGLQQCITKYEIFLNAVKESANFLGFLLWQTGFWGWGDESHHGVAEKYMDGIDTVIKDLEMCGLPSCNRPGSVWLTNSNLEYLNQQCVDTCPGGQPCANQNTEMEWFEALEILDQTRPGASTLGGNLPDCPTAQAHYVAGKEALRMQSISNQYLGSESKFWNSTEGKPLSSFKE